MDVEDSLSLRLIKVAILFIGIISLFIGWFVYYGSTSQYTFSTVPLPASSIPCYQNFTALMQSATLIYSFDFWLITLQPLVIGIFAFNLACVGSNLNQGITLLIAVLIFIGVILFSVVRAIYYAIAKASCNNYWFCVTPCNSTWGGNNVPSVEFYISWGSDFAFILISAAFILAIPLLRITRDAIKNRAMNGENIASKYSMVSQEDKND